MSDKRKEPSLFRHPGFLILLACLAFVWYMGLRS